MAGDHVSGPLTPSGGSGLIWTLEVSPYPATSAGLRSLLAGHSAFEPWIDPSLPSSYPAGSLLSSPVGHQPDSPDVVLAAMVGDVERLESFTARWPRAGIVLLGTDLELVAAIAPERPLAVLSLDADAASLIAAIHAVRAGLTVIQPALIDPERGIGPGLRSPPWGAGESDLLTPREREVLARVAEGLPNKTIAMELGISEHTVKFHVGSLLAKLGAASRTEAVTIATRRGILVV
ncbi:MAG TPA: response regulator transcription factor [Thermomicrobiales bacterium]|nr:response regulator transcription factor [Thermomicrobiales bacterium]